jgi:rRNA small subunit pseudouridine methyltransferase Nep1
LLNLIIADTSLEIIPINVFKNQSLKKIRNSGKKPQEILLDRSLHHFAMMSVKLEEDHKRGRPDILHIALLNALATPLYKLNHLSVFIHTIDNNVIFVGNNVRFPKSYFRFEGLMLNLFRDKKIVSEDGQLLFDLRPNTNFGDLLNMFIKPDIVFGLSTTGTLKNLESIGADLASYSNGCVVIGGFPKGHFTKKIESYFDKKLSISAMGLESQIVIARLLYEFEKNILF